MVTSELPGRPAGIFFIWGHVLVDGNPTMNTPRLRRGGGIASPPFIFYLYRYSYLVHFVCDSAAEFGAMSSTRQAINRPHIKYQASNKGPAYVDASYASCYPCGSAHRRICLPSNQIFKTETKRYCNTISLLIYLYSPKVDDAGDKRRRSYNNILSPRQEI